MKIIVQKFGGTSVKNEDSRKYAIGHIQDALSEGYKVVTVVSAMGREGDPYATDTLLGLVNGTKGIVSKREYDLLVSCGEVISSVVFSNELNQTGIKATAITGSKAGFRTNNDHQHAKIIDMECDELRELLNEFDVVVVAGFQGVSKNGDVTTLGRGGSDTSASALGVALNAEWIDIFTDVEGVMTADPRIVEDARPINVVTYTEICNMAYQGAKVIHPRAVEIAMHGKIPMRVRSTYSKSEGTLVTSLNEAKLGVEFKDRLITGIAHVSDVTQIKVFSKEGHYDTQKEVFKAMASAEISVDFFNITPTEVVYTVSGENTDKAIDILGNIGYEPVVTRNCAKVSAVGAGINGVPGVTSKIVTALSENGIQILQSADSNTTIWVLVKEDNLVEAVNALHTAFQLSEEENE
ncbi:aspartate kinase [Bacillus sp. BGMRC 2118]|nr:aspartate kinase [Bacillus sp. BGMRC 2118]